MTAMRNLLKGRRGFTLVELMVVVVVLGILAGIAVQRMGDVRDRAEQAAQDANARLLLGSANLAKVQNYAGEREPVVIRWRRDNAESQAENWRQTSSATFSQFTSPGQIPGGGNWDYVDYLEAFPVGYAVDIVFGTSGQLHVDNDLDDDAYDGEEIRVFRTTDDGSSWERIFPEFD